MFSVFIYQQENTLQLYPSAYLYKPINNKLKVKYRLNDISEMEGSVVGVSVTSETVYNVCACFYKGPCMYHLAHLPMYVYAV